MVIPSFLTKYWNHSDKHKVCNFSCGANALFALVEQMLYLSHWVQRVDFTDVLKAVYWLEWVNDGNIRFSLHYVIMKCEFTKQSNGFLVHLFLLIMNFIMTYDWYDINDMLSCILLNMDSTIFWEHLYSKWLYEIVSTFK
jgi:hypothetical protein